MGYELRTKVVEPKRNTFAHLVERFGDKPASRYQEATFNVQPTENFHYRPTWDADHELYDPDFSALKLADPYSYTDPRQYYYTPYVANAADRYESFAQTMKYIEERHLFDRLPEEWQLVLTDFVIPLRHYESGGQLISINGSRLAWGTTIEQACLYAAFDRIGNAQLLSLVGLALAGGSENTLGEAKKNWLYSSPLQGMRKFVEELLVEEDWAVGVIALELADAQLYPVLYAHLDDRALFRGAGAYSLLARHFHDWYGNHKKWLTALIKAWVGDSEHGDSNRKVLSEIADLWYPRAANAVHHVAEGIRDKCGSTSVVPACERAAAELAAELAKVGITSPPRVTSRRGQHDG
jgi:phenol hydroxylase P1 protein